MDILTEFIELCSYNRDIAQYINIINETDETVQVDYCVPFQRTLDFKNDFNNILSDIGFRIIESKSMPKGLGSGKYNISFYKPLIDGMVYKNMETYIEKLKKIQLERTKEENIRYNELKDMRQLHIQKQVDPLKNKIKELLLKSEDTEDKYEYHVIMCDIQDINKKIQLIKGQRC